MWLLDRGAQGKGERPGLAGVNRAMRVNLPGRSSCISSLFPRPARPAAGKTDPDGYQGRDRGRVGEYMGAVFVYLGDLCAGPGQGPMPQPALPSACCNGDPAGLHRSVLSGAQSLWQGSTNMAQSAEPGQWVRRLAKLQLQMKQERNVPP